MPRDWQAVVQSEEYSPVMRLVHLAMRLDSVAEERIRSELVRARRRAYEDELTIQARRVGCPNRSGRLTAGPALTRLNEMSVEDAASIVNTYNWDLAAAIGKIRSEVPTANRYVYAKKLSAWEAERNRWKSEQIAQFSEGTARSLAQADFARFNDLRGYAVLLPKEAVCPVCIGWVKRRQVPIEVATNSPPPYHPNCLPPDSLVRMADGSEKQIAQIIEGEVIASRRGSSSVVRVFQRHVQEDLYHLSVGGRVLRVTGDHPVLTAHGWRPVRELQVGERVAMVNSHGGGSDDT